MSTQATIIRAPRNHQYFILSISTPQDKSLSYEARGMLCYILSKPDNWIIQPSDLQQNCSRGKVYKILNELIAAGYIEDRKRTKNEAGKFVWSSYIVHEKPVAKLTNAKPCDENHNMETMTWKPSQLDNTEVVNKETQTTPPTTQQPAVVSDVKASVTKSDELLPVVDNKLSKDEYDQYIELIHTELKAHRGQDMIYYHILRGTSKKHKAYSLTDSPLSLDEFRQYVKWYKQQRPNLSFPGQQKIASNIEEFRQTVQKRNPVTPVGKMQPAAPVQTVQVDVEDMQALQQMIEEQRKKIKGEAA
jgi:hypothetical protein